MDGCQVATAVNYCTLYSFCDVTWTVGVVSMDIRPTPIARDLCYSTSYGVHYVRVWLSNLNHLSTAIPVVEWSISLGPFYLHNRFRWIGQRQQLDCPQKCPTSTCPRVAGLMRCMVATGSPRISH